MSIDPADSIGIDVGGTNLRIGVFSGLNLIEEMRFQANFSELCKTNTPSAAWQKTISVTANAIQTVLQKYASVKAIGIGFPGFIDPQTQNIAQSPNLPGLRDVNLAADLSQVIGKKAQIKQIVVENDANAAAYGEYCLAGKPAGGLIYLGLGTGVGGGLILPDIKQHGKPYVGQHGCAMEVGHIIISQGCRPCGCGNLGCMETYASATGVSTTYFDLTNQQKSAAEIAALADAGDEHALFAYQDAANALAQALASILKVIDVNNIVIGGGMSHAWHLMQKGFDDQLENDLIPVLRDKITVKISTAKDTAGMLGAAMLASL